jgi:large subunit ribosomal protein L35
MPKIKTNKSTAKRFTVTGSGKIRRRRANLRHILTKKNAKRKRRLGDPAILSPANLRSVRRSLPNSL